MIKLVFGLALFLFIGWKVYNSYRNDTLGTLNFSDKGGSLLLLAIVLMPLNWLLESVKWQLLVRDLKKQSFWVTIADVLAGVSTSLLTPNRIGNFIGRTTGLEKENRTKAIIAIVHSNIAQFIASIIFGAMGLLLLGFENQMIEPSTIRFSAIIITVVAFVLFLYPKILDFNPLSRLYSDQMKKGLDYIQSESVALKMALLMLSMLRYLIFLVQFYLLLKAFGADPPAEILIPAIAMVYLITTIIPSFLFGKLFVREASALFVLEAYGVDAAVILASVFILWAVNLAIPSLFGGIVLFKR